MKKLLILAVLALMSSQALAARDGTSEECIDIGLTLHSKEGCEAWCSFEKKRTCECVRVEPGERYGIFRTKNKGDVACYDVVKDGV